MQVTETNSPRYTSDCILLKEKLLLQQSVHKVLRLRPPENTLCRGQPVTDMKTGNIPLKVRGDSFAIS